MSAERSAMPEIIGLEDEYEIIAELGRGGSAVVYRARDRALGRDVAIKVVRTHHARVDDEQLARLAREARTVAQLDHPRIVSVYAVRQLPDGLALVMQWIPGRTLKQRIIEEGPLPVSLALSVLRDVAGALGAAHQRGIVHRDVKPENIFLDAHRGTAMLSDFGIAVSEEHDTRLTMTGTAIGTPTYMAPELLDGGQPTPRSDVYALGLVAWEMLTGRQPWGGESLYGVIYRQKHDMLPTLDAFRSDVPDTVQYVIERALQKRAPARWAGGDGMLAQLDGSVLPADWQAWQEAHLRRAAARAQQPVQGSASMPAVVADASAQATRRFRRGEGDTASEAVPVPLGDASVSVTDESSDTAAATIMDDAPDWVIEQEQWQRTADRDEIVTRRVWPWAIAAASAIAVAVGVFGARDVTVPLARTPVVVTESVQTQEVPVVVAPRAVPGAPGDSVAPQLASDTARSDAAQAAEANGRLDEWPEEIEARPLAPASVPSRARPPAPPTFASPTRESVAPVNTPSYAPVTRVAVVGAYTLTVGGRHSCVVVRARVMCWGANEDGQLGNGSSDAEPATVGVRGDMAFTSISAGFAHTCGVVRGGAVYCWGNGEAGQLGDATTTSRTAPVRVASSLSFALVRAARDHSCALTDTGSVACWGRNTRGQLGDGTTVGRSSPVLVPTVAPFRALAVGAAHSCALSVEGAAYCWGANESGQLGIGSTRPQPQPTPVAMSLRFVDIAAGNANTCAVSLARDVWCWGRLNGAVRTSPARVPGPARVQAITAGSVHSCARTEAGTVWCWGGNEYGQVGNGTTGSYAQPQPIGDRRFDTIVANGAHTCALSSREVWCWGYNADGQVAPRNEIDTSDSAPSSALSTAVTRPTRVRGVNGGGI